MSTRSRIGIQNQDGTVTSVYCHYDGYPDEVGRLLLFHYPEEAKVRDLISLGDLSYLAEHVGPPAVSPFTSWDSALNEYPYICRAYGRDRGDRNVEARTVPSRHAYAREHHGGEEYLYLFDSGQWLVLCVRGRAKFVGLQDLLDEGDEEEITTVGLR